MSNAGRYYGLFGSSGHHRRYLLVMDPKTWALFTGYGGTAKSLARRFHRETYMAYAVRVQRGRTGMVRVIAWFPTVLPIRGAGNPPGAFRPYPH